MVFGYFRSFRIKLIYITCAICLVSVHARSTVSADPYYKHLPSFVHTTSVDWIHGNISYPWLTLLATEGAVTHAFQRRLYDHQRPRNCNNKRVLIAMPYNNGLGSDLHTITSYLSVAMNTDRIMAFEPPSTERKWVWTNGSTTCSTPDCYFADITSCREVIYRRLNNLSDFQVVVQEIEVRAFKGSIGIGITSGYEPSLVPLQLPRVIHDAPPNSNWRAQAIKYLFKPNHFLLENCYDFLRSKLVKLDNSARNYIHENVNSHPPIGSIGIHVRHGDKWTEAKLHEFNEYLDAAETLLNAHKQLTRNIILSTDDPGLLEILETNTTARRGFTFYYTLFERSASKTVSPIQAALRSGVDLFMTYSIANLIIATHPNIGAFVQTTSSNWNRLINELRLLDGKRLTAPSIDLVSGEWR